MPEQVPDVFQVVVDHRWPLETEAPRDNIDVVGQAHGTQHFGAEDAGVADLDVHLEAGVVSEDFQRRLCVRVVGWLVLQVGDANFAVECANNTHQVRQPDIPIRHESLTLVELGQMCRIQCLISEHAINREVLDRLKLLLLRKLIQHLRTDRGRVRPQDILGGLLLLPLVLVAL